MGATEDEEVVLVTTVGVEEELTTADEDGGTAMLLGAFGIGILKGNVDDDGITADEDDGILGAEDDGSATTGTLGTEDGDDEVETLLLVAAVLDEVAEDEGVTVKV
jgi:hypothetical protein